MTDTELRLQRALEEKQEHCAKLLAEGLADKKRIAELEAKLRAWEQSPLTEWIADIPKTPEGKP